MFAGSSTNHLADCAVQEGLALLEQADEARAEEKRRSWARPIRLRRPPEPDRSEALTGLRAELTTSQSQAPPWLAMSYQTAWRLPHFTITPLASSRGVRPGLAIAWNASPSGSCGRTTAAARPTDGRDDEPGAGARSLPRPALDGRHGR